jgi:hypothetical protein
MPSGLAYPGGIEKTTASWPAARSGKRRKTGYAVGTGEQPRRGKAENMDIDLAVGIKQARTHVINFVMIGKGLAEPHILMAKSSRVSPERIKDYREANGGKVVNRGRCWFEDETLVFYCEMSAAMGLDRHLRALILRESHMLYTVEIRSGAANAKPRKPEIEGVEESPGEQTDEE